MIAEIRDRIFMGCGEHSMAQCYYLTSELHKAFEILNGIQQPPRPVDPPDLNWDNEVEEGEIELERIAREIYIGLTGKKPKLKE